MHPTGVELFHVDEFDIRFSEIFKRARKRKKYIQIAAEGNKFEK